MLYRNQTYIHNASMTGNVTGPATVIQLLPGISYDCSWTGTPSGTFSVQVSNTVVLGPEGSGTILVPGNWYTLPSAALIGVLPTPSGTPGNGFIDVIGTEAYAIRLVYNALSGTGLLTVAAAAKVL